MTGRKALLWISIGLIIAVGSMFTYLLVNMVIDASKENNLFACTLLGILMPLGIIFLVGLISSIRNKIQAEDFALKVIGIHPSALPKWKWAKYAEPKMDTLLAQLAKEVILLDQQEKEALNDKHSPPERILEFHKEIKRRIKEYRKAHDAFIRLDLQPTRKSWTEYRT